jgi:sensor histidine kinase YesM
LLFFVKIGSRRCWWAKNCRLLIIAKGLRSAAENPVNLAMATAATDIIFKPGYRLLRHILFWVVYFVVITLIGAPAYPNFWIALQPPLFFTPVNIIYTYIILYGLVPRLLLRGKILQFALFFTLCVVLGQAFIFFYRHFVIARMVPDFDWPEPGIPIYRQLFDFSVWMVMNMVALFAVFISAFKYWSQEQQKKMLLEREKTTAELELLKAQLQPHFLLSALKNLYSMVREKSDKAPDMLMRLSGLLNYVLYECKAPEVPLEKEIQVIKDYIALEQKRYGDRLEVSLSFTGEIEGKMIAPMLFQPFVENAFKHDVSDLVDRVWMSIELSIKNEQLFFRLVNNITCADPDPVTNEMGVCNVRRRLELLYPDRFSLDQETGEDVYITSLIIERPT